jgi:L-aminopeptidase/D-esterase-like protein
VGSASVQTDDGLIVGALAVVNSLGEVSVPGRRAFWAWPFEMDGEFGDHGAPEGDAPIYPGLSLPPALRDPGMSTTLVAVATNASLTHSEATRVSVMGHSGVARAIRPVHTLFDGDIVYTIATGEVDAGDELRQMLIGNLAADCVARAIARAVYHAGPHPTLPSWQSAHSTD